VTGGQQFRPLLVAGVAGGVGTSTWVRILRLATTLPVEDVGVYPADQPGRPVDILVCSNTAAAAARLGPVLGGCPRPPLLVVMHTASGVLTESRSYLRIADPHVTARFAIAHRRAWLEMAEAPGARLPPKAGDIERAATELVPALQAMYARPRPSALAGRTTGPTTGPAAPPGPPMPAGGLMQPPPATGTPARPLPARGGPPPGWPPATHGGGIATRR